MDKYEYRGLKFKSFRAFIKMLGYNSNLSKKWINLKYGSLDNLVMLKLNLKAKNEIVPALKILLNNNKNDSSNVLKTSNYLLTLQAKAIIKTILTKNINDIAAYKNVFITFGILPTDENIENYKKEIEKFLKEF